MNNNLAAICQYSLQSGIPLEEISWSELKTERNIALSRLTCMRFVASLRNHGHCSPAEQLAIAIESKTGSDFCVKLYIRFNDSPMTPLQLKLAVSRIERDVGLKMHVPPELDKACVAHSADQIDGKEFFKYFVILVQKNYNFLAIVKSLSGGADSAAVEDPDVDVPSLFSGDINLLVPLIPCDGGIITDGRSKFQNIVDALYIGTLT